MVSLANTDILTERDEAQLECLDTCYANEKPYFDSMDEDKSNPLSVINLLNRPCIFEFQHEDTIIEQQEVQLEQEEKPKKNKKFSLYDDTNFQSNSTPIYNQKLTLDQFIKYLNLKINGDKNHVITKDTLSVFYNQIRLVLNLGTLTRSEKRSKIKVFMKLYKCANDVIYYLENKPHFFLDPTLLHIRLKINKRKKYRFRTELNEQINNC